MTSEEAKVGVKSGSLYRQKSAQNRAKRGKNCENRAQGAIFNGGDAPTRSNLLENGLQREIFSHFHLKMDGEFPHPLVACGLVWARSTLAGLRSKIAKSGSFSGGKYCPFSTSKIIGFAIGGYKKARSVWDLVIARVLTERSGPEFALDSESPS